MRQRCFVLLLLFCVLFSFAAQAAPASGMPLSTFGLNYEENVYFINNNTGRHLLPLRIAQESMDEDTRQIRFAIIGDTLSLTGATDVDGQVVDTCLITLTLPGDYASNTLSQSDYEISGYHCYALLMAMDGNAAAEDRYELVSQAEQALRDALADGETSFHFTVGLYTLTGERTDTSMRLYFENNTLRPTATPEPVSTPDASQAPDGDGGTGDEDVSGQG